MAIKIQKILSTDNIAELLDGEQLDQIGAEAVHGYDEDLISRSTWEERTADYIKMASQIVEKKTFPWENAANINYPLLTTAAVNFAARAYPALVPAYSPVRCRVIGRDDTGQKETRAIRIGKHMSFQLMEEMPEWEDHMDKLCTILPIVGTCFKKTYYDPVQNRNCSELVLPQDLVINYYAKSVEDAQRKTHKLWFNDNDLYERVQTGLYLDIELPKVIQISSKEQETSDKIQGLNQGNDEPLRLILEQHTFLDLDEDGYQEPYIVVTDYQSRKVLRISARFGEDSVQMVGPKIQQIEPDEYFTKFEFIPSPDGGLYGLGYGPLLAPLNHTINTAVNQLLDAGTMNNLQSGFIGRGIRLKGGNIKLGPGEWVSVPSTGQDLRQNIMPLPTKEPSPTLLNLVGMMVNSGERLGSVTDLMVGENPGQNQKATTTMAVLDQGMKVFNAVYKRMHRSLRKEYKKLFKLNSLYLDDQLYFRTLDPRENEVEIMRGDYNLDDLDVVPASDPSTSTEQLRMAKVQQLLQLLSLGLNQQEVVIRVLEAMEQPGIERLLQPNPPATPPDIALEQVKLQFEQQKWQFEAQMRVLEHQNKSLNDRATSVARLMQAEAQQKGVQLDWAAAKLQELDRQEQTFNESLENLRSKLTPEGGESGNNEGGVPSMETGQGDEGSTEVTTGET